MSVVGLVDPRLLRSVRLEHDWYTSDPTEDYVLGTAAADVLREVMGATQTGPRPRAFTITGPYGTGKSALALFLADMLCGEEKRRGRALVKSAPIADGLRFSRGFLPVLATCRPASIESVLQEAFHGAAQRYGLKLPDSLEELVRETALEGFDGVLIVIDELGKALEFAAKAPLASDLFVLQQIAEFAARSELPVVVVGVLHQSFAGYADGLDASTRNEWAKVQGRYRDLPFLPSEAMLAHLIAESIGAAPSKVSEIDGMAREVRRIPGLWPSSMEERAFLELARKSWPLHPLTVTALPTLMRRFGQNERSLFAFLVERGLLTGPTDKNGVRLADLFEDVSDWIGHGNRSRAAARRWRLALELLHARPGWDKTEQDVLRTVALLTALGSFAPFQATTEAVSLALPGQDVKSALERLKERSAIVHRRHLGAWVLWEGSDVDLDGLLDRARVAVSGRANLAKVLGEAGALRPPVAQKHYEETGTLRWFKPVVLTDPDSIKLPDPKEDPTNGVIVLALGATPGTQSRFEAWAKQQDRPDMVVAVIHRSPALRNLVEELEAVFLVEQNSPELRGDRVARQELAARKASLSAAIADEAERLLDPSGSDGCLFFHRGAESGVESRRGLSRLLSEVCDELFPHAPILRNELINRRSLSSAAAAARRDLLQAMLERGDQPKLAYGDGYPPDRSMYESVLLESGLHRPAIDGKWGFAPPSDADRCRLGKVWQHLEERLFGEFPRPIRVDELAAELSQPPFGVVEGPFPILLATFLLVHQQETAVYREGAFVPDFSIAHWELLLRRPELFAVAGCRQTGARKHALELVCSRLGVEPAALMPAVRYVIKTVHNLPNRAKTTKEVSKAAAAVRKVALEASSPEAFFFSDLPKALGLATLGENEDEAAAMEFLERLRNVLRELFGVVDVTRTWGRAQLAKAAGYSPDDTGFTALRHDAARLRDRLDDPKARDLCDRLAAADPESAEIGALSLVAMRPVESWTDKDRDDFLARASVLTQELRGESARAGVLPDPQADTKAQDLADLLYREWRSQTQTDAKTLLAALKRLVRRMEEEGTQ